MKKHPKKTVEQVHHQWILVGAVSLTSLFVLLTSVRELSRNINEYARSPSTFFVREKTNHGWIEIDFGNGKKRVFEGMMGDIHYPLHQALSAIAQSGKLSLRINKGEIRMLDGFMSPPGTWQVYRNGIPANAPIEAMMLTKGDRYLLRYVPPSTGAKPRN
ncbi:MAG: hypothetical protein HY006_01940 [Candidatus Sungbacteria bacterium]|nr:hypothetical protein [Candidatus Sungbacteria bacterium]